MNIHLFVHHVRDTETDKVLSSILGKLETLQRNQEILMTASDDLKQALADLKTQLDINNTEIETLLTKITTPGSSEADIAAAAQSIRDLIATNKAETDKAAAVTGV